MNPSDTELLETPTRVRHDIDGRDGTVTDLDENYRAAVAWDDGNPEPAWVSRRHLIIVAHGRHF